eukprot:gnl/MRDRNA2_/MRDRNA2_15326_c0_seq1.p1 gnl/MRDRNA2_/MRDRNA2_15326_c0~~gnl/MRDRNA2_/MRDRNA2_15326_c0_seq1.p1  ORF type:complete len:536 (+),score=90.38 gnl/MRDRNA2_/MRDRNA2_15326_c0_seq1:148-1755(+)
MIRYKADKYQFKFIFSLKGSVFPKALIYAFPSSLLALALKLWLSAYCEDKDIVCYGDESELPPFLQVASNSTVYTGFTFVVGFLLVFRTSQAYTRYAEGATLLHMMRGEWYDACSTLIAFTHASKKLEDAIEVRHIMVRLFSLLHSCALQEIASLEDEEFPLIDIGGIDADSLDYIQLLQSDSPHFKVDVVFQWIQCLVTQNLGSGVMPVPAPILTRVYQELSQGMVNFQNALKITDTPFPYPYAQMITVLLLLHLALTPLTVVMFTLHWFWCLVFAFVPVFCFWCINFIAAEIENPFGDDVNDLPIQEMQESMNKALLLLLDSRTCRVPTLSSSAVKHFQNLKLKSQKSFNQAMTMKKGSKSSFTRSFAGKTCLDLSPEAMEKQRESDLQDSSPSADLSPTAQSYADKSSAGDSGSEFELLEDVQVQKVQSSQELPKTLQPSTSKAASELSLIPSSELTSIVRNDVLPELRQGAFEIKTLMLRFEDLQQQQLSALLEMCKDTPMHGRQALSETASDVEVDLQSFERKSDRKAML